MYKIIIADDEFWTVENLRKSVDWDKYGFEVIDAAENGIEAFEKIRERKPDVALIDIRMPGMTGLQVIKEIREAGINTMFIIISSFADFDYAREAIEHDVLGYCLKPLELNEVERYLLKAKAILDEQKKSDSIDEIIMLSEEYSAENNLKINGLFKMHGICPEKGDKVIPLIIISSEKLDFSIIETYFHINLGAHRNLCFFKYTDSFSADLKRLFENSHYIKAIGFGTAYDGNNNLAKCIDEAEKAANDYFCTCNRGIYEFAEPKSELVNKYFPDIINTIAQKDLPACKAILDTLTGYFHNRLLNITNAMGLFNIVNTLSKTGTDEYIDNINQLPQMFENVDKMLEYLYSVIRNQIIGAESNKMNLSNSLLVSIIQYIDQNFTKYLNLQLISEMFVINPNYFSQIFKKAVGETFTEYITKKRIGYACVLLRNSEHTINEIAIKSGYEDYLYFRKVFKKYTGVTPSDFRQER